MHLCVQLRLRTGDARIIRKLDAVLAQWQSSGFVNHRFRVRAPGTAQTRAIRVAILRPVADSLVLWHDFNVSVVTAAAALLGLLFVALSLHLRALTAPSNAELRSIARTVFLGYVVALGMGFLALFPQDLGAYGIELL